MLKLPAWYVASIIVAFTPFKANAEADVFTLECSGSKHVDMAGEPTKVETFHEQYTFDLRRKVYYDWADNLQSDVELISEDRIVIRNYWNQQGQVSQFYINRMDGSLFYLAGHSEFAVSMEGKCRKVDLRRFPKGLF